MSQFWLVLAEHCTKLEAIRFQGLVAHWAVVLSWMRSEENKWSEEVCRTEFDTKTQAVQGIQCTNMEWSRNNHRVLRQRRREKLNWTCWHGENCVNFAVSWCEMLKNITGPTSGQLILDSNRGETNCFSCSCKFGHGLQLYWREWGFERQSRWTESQEMSASLFLR